MRKNHFSEMDKRAAAGKAVPVCLDAARTGVRIMVVRTAARDGILVVHARAREVPRGRQERPGLREPQELPEPAVAPVSPGGNW